jgi:uncharacterized coiled-coil protein SlyX
MPKSAPTVEEILAQQRADIERLNQQLAEKDTQIALSQSQIATSLSSTHVRDVDDKVKRLQRSGYPAGVLLAARQVYIQDSPVAERDDDGSLQLSVQAPGEKPGETVEKKIASPTEIVDFLLSAMPTEQGQAATLLASINDGLGDLQLAAHDAVNGTLESREEAARKGVDEWMKANGRAVAEPAPTPTSA